MERRGYLALLGSSIAVAFAGCGDPSEPGNTETPGTDATEPTGDAPPDGTAGTPEATTETQTTAGEPTTQTTGAPTTTQSADEDATIEGSILVDGVLGEGPGKRVNFTVTNQGNASSGKVAITVQWYDENETVLGNSTEHVASPAPGETVTGEVYASDAAGVTDAQVAGHAIVVTTV